MASSQNCNAKFLLAIEGEEDARLIAHSSRPRAGYSASSNVDDLSTDFLSLSCELIEPRERPDRHADGAVTKQFAETTTSGEGGTLCV